MNILLSRGLYDEHLGGAEIEVLDFARLLVADGHSVNLLTNSLHLTDRAGNSINTTYLAWPRTKSSFVLARALLVPLRFIRFFISLVNTARREKPNLIIAESREDGIAFAFSKKMHHVPLLWRDHADLRHQLKIHKSNILAKAYQSVLVRALRKTDAIATVSKYDAEHIAKFVDKPNLIHIIHPGAVIDKRIHSKSKGSSGVPVIGVVSRLVKDKGIQYLIEAVSTFPSDSYKLTIVGDGPHRNKLKEMADMLNVDVMFAGYSPNPDEHYASFDIFVQPSLYEGWSKTVIEAMLCGLPVVASDIPSHREQIESGKSGLLFKAGDVSDLKTKLNMLLSDGKLRSKIGNEAQRTSQKIGDFKATYNSEFAPLLNRLSS